MGIGEDQTSSSLPAHKCTTWKFEIMSLHAWIRASVIMLFFFFSKLCAQNSALCELRNIFRRKFQLFSLLSLQVFFFFFYTKLSILKLKRKHGKHSCAELCGKKWQNKSEKGAFFLFQAVFGYISSNHNTCYMKELVHRSQRPAA